MKTVAIFPPAIYFLSATVVLLSLTLLAFVRIPQKIDADAEERVDGATRPHVDREQTLVEGVPEIDVHEEAPLLE